MVPTRKIHLTRLGFSQTIEENLSYWVCMSCSLDFSGTLDSIYFFTAFFILFSTFNFFMVSFYSFGILWHCKEHFGTVWFYRLLQVPTGY